MKAQIPLRSGRSGVMNSVPTPYIALFWCVLGTVVILHVKDYITLSAAVAKLIMEILGASRSASFATIEGDS